MNIEEIRYLVPGSTVVRRGAARPAIKVYVHMFRIFWIRGVFWVRLGLLGFIRLPESRKSK